MFRIRSSVVLRHGRRYCTVSKSSAARFHVVPPPNVSLRPFHLLWIAGPLTPLRCYERAMRTCATYGFASVAINPWSLLQNDRPTIGALVKSLSAEGREHVYPPVVVAHGLSALLAQYYLEDLPAKGLVMLAPYPSNFNLVEKLLGTDSTHDIKLAATGTMLLQNATTKDDIQLLLSEESPITNRLCNGDQSCINDVLHAQRESIHGIPSVSFDILVTIAKRPPLFEVDTGVPISVLGFKDDQLITAEELSQTITRYELEEDMDVFLMDGSHYAFVTEQGGQTCALQICEWLDNNIF